MSKIVSIEMLPLRAARARLEHATGQIDRIESEFARLGHAPAELAHRRAGWSNVEFAPPFGMAILIAEAVHNLKGALDWLASELFEDETGARRDDIRFPIHFHSEGWDQNFPQPDTADAARASMWLHRLPQRRQTFIRNQQPFMGCRWTAALHKLDRRNPGRRLFRVVRAGQQGVRLAAAGGANLAPAGKAEAAFCFADGKPVVETLRTIQQGVELCLLSLSVPEPDAGSDEAP